MNFMIYMDLLMAKVIHQFWTKLSALNVDKGVKIELNISSAEV